MSASIWAPGTAISASGSVQNQAFTATAGQTLFTLTAFAYEPSVGSLAVYVSGLAQRPGIDFTETSSSSFTLTSAVEDGTIVLAVGQTEIVATVPVVGADPATIGASKYVHVNAGATAFEGKSAAQVLADIGAQAYDADTAKLDVAQTWTAAQQFPSIELGHASDTTLTRVSAGVVAVEGATVAVLSSTQAFSKAQSGTPVALTVSANAVAVDLSLGNNFTLTLQATTAQTLSNPSNVVAGQKGAIYITQNATPSTLAVASNWIEASTGTNPGVSTTASAQNILTYDVFDSTHIYYTIMKHGVT